jgi:hypothetical protein
MDSIYVTDGRHDQPLDFSTGDPMDVFAAAEVYVQYDSDRAGRRPITQAVPGHAGRWILAYSSLSNLHDAAHGDDEIEYSHVIGAQVVADLAGAGVWLDRGFPGGRQILLPAPDLDIEAV